MVFQRQGLLFIIGHIMTGQGLKKSGRIFFFFLLFFWVGLPCALRADSTELELKVQSAFIFQFTRFIEWPADRGQFIIYIIEDKALSDLLQETTKGKSVGSRQIQVKLGKWPDPLESSYDIIVFPKGDTTNVQASIKKLKEKSCLTVTYTEGMAANGSVINFFMADGKLKFEINRKTAAENSLKVSSQLLKLARVL